VNSRGISRREFLRRTGLGTAALALPKFLNPRQLLPFSSASPFGLTGNKVFLIENHNEALLFWLKEGIKDKVLVHLDAHGDIRHIPPWQMEVVLEAKGAEEIGAHLKMPNEPYHPQRFISFANFLYAAVGLGVVKEIVWVVPEAELEVKDFDAARNRLGRALFTSAGSFDYKEGRWQGYAYETKFTITPLDNLPTLNGSLLLDMDVDFFTFRSFVNLRHRSVPRIWPPAVLDILLKKAPRPSVVTICYSVQNGFTPLRFRYLGHWFEGLVKGEGGSKLEAWQWLKEGDLAFATGDTKRALDFYQKGLSEISDYAPLHFSSAVMFESLNNEKKAEEGFRKSSRLDPIYERQLFYRAQAEVTGGGDFNKSANLYRRFLEKNPQDIPALFEFGIVSFWLGKYGQAEEAWKKILAKSPQEPEALGFLGAVELERGEPEATLKNLEASLAGGPDALPPFFGALIFAYKWKEEKADSLRLFSDQLQVVWDKFVYEEEARFENLVALLRQELPQEGKWQEAMETGLRKMLRSLHPEAAILTQAEYDSYLKLRQGNLPGIGASISYTPSSGVIFSAVLPESPAEKGGISPGDKFLEIDGRKTNEFSLVHLRLALSGEERIQTLRPLGDQVELLVSSADGKSREVMLQPRILAGQAISYSREGQVSYMRTTQISSSRRNELTEAMSDLSAAGPDELILDLRSGEGDMETTALLAGLFLGEGRFLGFARGRGVEHTNFYSAGGHFRFTGRLAVLIDENTEGPIELLSAALKIYRPCQARLFGRATAGKNLVTKDFCISDSGKTNYLVLPAAELYSPDGTRLGKVGPDVRIEGPWPKTAPSPLPKLSDLQKEDKAVKAALSWLRLSP